MPNATMNAAKKCAQRRHQPSPEQQNAEERRLQEERHQPLIGHQRREHVARSASVKRLQLVPNWNGMMMPDTTPMPNETAKILVQKLEMRNQISRPVKK